MENELLHKSITDKIGKVLISSKQTIAVAESVTAGHLQTCLSLADKALEFFQGGITAYNIGQKTKHLGVNPIHALATNCVSEKIAGEMAKNVAVAFNSDWGIGITGYASPVPEKNIEELFACFAIARHQQIIILETVNAIKQSALNVRLFYSKVVLEKLLAALQQ